MSTPRTARGRLLVLAIAVALALVGALLWWVLMGKDEDGAGVEGTTVHVAVSAGFAVVQEELSVVFKARTGMDVVTTVDSTEVLFEALMNGAAYDVFMSDDERHPQRLVLRGVAYPTSKFHYAFGQLALYGPTLDSVRVDGADLREGDFTHVAIPDPQSSAYGAAAFVALRVLGLPDSLRPRVVEAGTLADTYDLVHTDSVELGLVALWQVIDEPEGIRWTVPVGAHPPLTHSAVLMRSAYENEAAREWTRFLRSDEARAIITARGYAIHER